MKFRISQHPAKYIKIWKLLEYVNMLSLKSHRQTVQILKYNVSYVIGNFYTFSSYRGVASPKDME